MIEDFGNLGQRAAAVNVPLYYIKFIYIGTKAGFCYLINSGYLKTNTYMLLRLRPLSTLHTRPEVWFLPLPSLTKTGLKDLAERRKRQNRISYRNYRVLC